MVTLYVEVPGELQFSGERRHRIYLFLSITS